MDFQRARNGQNAEKWFGPKTGGLNMWERVLESGKWDWSAPQATLKKAPPKKKLFLPKSGTTCFFCFFLVKNRVDRAFFW